MKNYDYQEGNIMFLYDFIVSIFGDNQKSRKIYKIIKLFLVSAIFLYIIIKLILYGISILDSMGTGGIIVYCLIIIVITAIWIFLCQRNFKKNYKNLHALPILKGVDLKGCKLKIIEPNGENVFIINCCNGYTIDLIYKNYEYNIVIKNDEWDVIKQIKAKTQDDIRRALIEAIDLVVNNNTIKE